MPSDAAPTPADKAARRRAARRQRRALPTGALSAQICAHLAGWLGSGPVALYAAFRSEIDPGGLPALRPGQYLLPRVAGQALTFHALPCPLVTHRWGMREPAPEVPAVAPGPGWTILVPGLLFDRAGYRLGYGGGFYDRLLASLPPGATTVGLAPSALLRDAVPREVWDLPVGAVVTERGVLELSS